MWTPDVYEGAPTPVTGFMASATKAAGFAALLRVLFTAFDALPDRLAHLDLGARGPDPARSAASPALVQTDLKRMLAYSSIAHAGYVLIGVAGGDRAAACSPRSSTCSCTRS